MAMMSGPSSVERADPGDEAALELLGVERPRRWSPSWSCDGVPSSNGRKRRRSSSFFSPNLAISTQLSPPASTPTQDTAAAPRRADRAPCRPGAGLQALEMLQPLNDLIECPLRLRLGLHHRACPPRIKRTPTDSAFAATCHAKTHPIALPKRGVKTPFLALTSLPRQPSAPAVPKHRRRARGAPLTDCGRARSAPRGSLSLGEP